MRSLMAFSSWSVGRGYVTSRRHPSTRPWSAQRQNKMMAMKILTSRLYEMMQHEQAEKIEELSGEKREIAWGNQIRSYVFHPYNMIKDHRTEVERGDVQNVMDGDLERYITAYLRSSLATKN